MALRYIQQTVVSSLLGACWSANKRCSLANGGVFSGSNNGDVIFLDVVSYRM